MLSFCAKNLTTDYISDGQQYLSLLNGDEIAELSYELKGEAIDVLLNNAGVYFEKYKSGTDLLEAGDWSETFKVNTIAPMCISEAFINHVARSDRRLIVAITSHMGSIAEISQPGSYYYRSSKAALNAAMKGLSVEVNARGVGVLLLHPGWVRTRMGGHDAPLTIEESITGMAKLVSHFSLNDTGHFYRYNGTEIPW